MTNFIVRRRSDSAVLTRAGFMSKVNPPRHFSTFEEACLMLVNFLHLPDRSSLPVGEYQIVTYDRPDVQQSIIDPSSGEVCPESVNKVTQTSASDSSNDVVCQESTNDIPQASASDASNGEVCQDSVNEVMCASAEDILRGLREKFKIALEPTYRSRNVNAPLFDLYHAAEFTDDSSDDVLLFDALKEQADKHKVVREGLDIVNKLLNAIAAADGYGR